MTDQPTVIEIVTRGGPSVAEVAVRGPQGAAGPTGATGPSGPAGAAGGNAAERLLGGAVGAAGDAIAQVSTASGGAASEAGMVFSRDTVAYDIDGDGYRYQLGDDVAIVPSRDPTTGENLGHRIHQPSQNLIYRDNDYDHDSWNLFNDATATLQPAEIGPDGETGHVWLLEDANAIDDAGEAEPAFGGMEFLVGEGVAADNEWFTAFAYFKQPATSASPVSQMKVVFYEQGNAAASAVGNIIIDHDNRTMVDVVEANSPAPSFGDVVRMRDGWSLAWVSTKNNANSKSGVKWYLLIDTTSKEAASSILIERSGIVRGKGFPGFRMPEDQPVRPVLTSAKWNTLAGSATVGLYAANNIADLTFEGTGWGNSSVASPVQQVGDGIGGVDAWRLQDNSGTVFGFYQYTKATGIGTSDYLEFPVFLNRTTYTGQQVEFRHNVFSGGTLLQPRVSVDIKARKVISITNDVGGTAWCEVHPTPDTDIDLWIVGFRNNGTGNVAARFLMYPDFAEVSGQGILDASQPGILNHAADDKWARTAVPELDSDHLSIDLTDKYWSGTTFTVAADFGLITPPLAGSPVVLISIDKGTANGRWELRIETDDDADEVYYAVAKVVADDGSEDELPRVEVELADARHALRCGAEGWGYVRDDVELGWSLNTSYRPTALTNIRFGEDYAGIKTANTTEKRWFHVATLLSPSEIDQRGSTGNSSSTPFAEGDLAIQHAQTIAAAAAELARAPGVVFFKPTDFKKGIISHPMTQSLGNGGTTTDPPYIDGPFLDTLDWDTTKAQMFYGSYRGATSVDNEFVEVTDYADTSRGPGFNRLEEVSQKDANIYSQAEIEAGTSYAAGASGGSPIVSVVQDLLRRIQNAYPTIAHEAVGLVAGSKNDGSLAAVAGLVTPTDSAAWNRETDALGEIRTEALADGFLAAEIGVYLAVILKGEAERYESVDDIINGTPGVEPCGIGYDAALDNIDARNQAVFSVTSSKKVLKIASLPTMHWIGADMSPARAWQQLEQDREDVRVFCATYTIQNSGVNGDEHPTPLLGSALLGLHAADCAAKLLIDETNFFIPFEFKAWWLEGTKRIRIGICAMDYPMVWKKTYPYRSTGLNWITDYGFRVYRGAQGFKIDSLEILEGGAVLEIVLLSKPTGVPTIEYAGYSPGLGRGNLFDSRPPFEEWLYRFLAYDKPERIALDLDPDSPTYGEEFYTEGDPLPGNRGCRPFRIECEVWRGV